MGERIYLITMLSDHLGASIGGTVFTEERKLTPEEIAQLSDKSLSRKSKVEIATAFIKEFTGMVLFSGTLITV